MKALGAVGLSSDEAAARFKLDGPNELPTAKPRGFLKQAWDVLRQPMLFLLLIAGTINFLISEPLDGFLLLGFVLLVIAISIYQARKSERALSALRDLTAPRASVLRDGIEQKIPSREIVVGDIMLVNEGDRVAADAVLLDCVNLSADESSLTGESVPVSKQASMAFEMGKPGGDSTPFIFAGTLLVRGRGRAQVLATATRTELGSIGLSLKSISKADSPLEREIDRLVTVIATIALAAAALVAVMFGLTRGLWLQGALAGIATAMAMLPEEFPVVLTIFMALGSWRMSKINVLAKNPMAIETLGSATVICTDKTGTLTTNRMQVSEFYMASPDNAHCATMASLASAYEPTDPMDKAFRLESPLGDGWDLIREYPMTSDLLAITHIWRQTKAESLLVASKGAPEAIISLCKLDEKRQAEIFAQVELAAAKGERVLGVAEATLKSESDIGEDPTEYDFRFVGLVGLKDPVRPAAAEAVANCYTAGIRPIMITGDYPATALAIATEIGIEVSAGALTGAQLSEMPDDELSRQVLVVNIYARMVPAQKLRIIAALRAHGEVVAMTGDGVNDAPALKAADIGIAMGMRGTDVARETADLVITDDDFASIAKGIRAGRGIFANLRKAMAYIVAVHVPIFGMTLIPVFVSAWPLALIPILIAFLELIIDPTSSVVFESEAVDPEVMNRPPRKLGESILKLPVLLIALTQGLSALIAVLCVYFWGIGLGLADETVRSLSFVALVVGNLALMLTNRSWNLSLWSSLRVMKNPAVLRILLATLAILALVLLVAPIRESFKLDALDALQWVVAILAGLSGIVWFEVYKAVLRLRRRPSKSDGH